MDTLLILLLATEIVVLLDVPVLRQVVGFFYLLFLPGFLILRIIRVDGISLIERLLLSTGLSIAFLMLIGLLSNQIYPLLNILKPLSVLPIVTTIFISTLALYAVAHYRSRNLPKQPLPNFKSSNLFPLLISIPVLTILGIEMLLYSGNNIVLLLTVIIISIIMLFASFKKLVPSKTYLLVVFVISFFLLFHVSLASGYIIGYDVHLEYYFANLTSINSYWNRFIPHEYNAMLSITILPVEFSNFLNLDLNWVFKAIYPLILSFVPLALLVTYKKLTGSRIALLSVFLFMAIDVFYFTMLGLTRQIIAELFLALLILLIMEDKISIGKRKLLFLIFSAGLIVSHYALSYIFLFYILFTFCLMFFWNRSGVKHERLITIDLLLMCFAMAMTWYVLVSPEPFNALATTVEHIYQSIIEGSSLPGIGGLMPRFVSPLHQASQYLFYGLQLAIFVGLIWHFIRRKKTRFNREYFSMALVSLFILILCIVVPSFAAGLVMTRFYQITFFFLAPFFALGILSIFRVITNFRNSHNMSCSQKNSVRLKNIGLFLVSLSIVLLLLFQVGFIYEIAQDAPSSIPLSLNRLKNNPRLAGDIWQAQTSEQDVLGAKWLYRYVDNQSKVFADRISNFMVLTSYGMRQTMHFTESSRVGTYDYILSLTSIRPSEGEYIYLREYNVVHGLMVDSTYKEWNTTSLYPFLQFYDKLYTNGGSEIYLNPK